MTAPATSSMTKSSSGLGHGRSGQAARSSAPSPLTHIPRPLTVRPNQVANQPFAQRRPEVGMGREYSLATGGFPEADFQ